MMKKMFNFLSVLGLMFVILLHSSNVMIINAVTSNGLEDTVMPIIIYDNDEDSILYQIIVSEVAGGSIGETLPENAIRVASKGTILSFEIFNDIGYTLESVTIHSGSAVIEYTIENGELVFTMPGNGVTITPVFVANTYKVNTSQLADGFNYDGPTEAQYGDLVEFKLSWDLDYIFTAIINDPDNNMIITKTDDVYSFVMPSNSVYIHFEYERKTYEITIYDQTSTEVVSSNKYNYQDEIELEFDVVDGYVLSNNSIEGVEDFILEDHCMVFTMPLQNISIAPEYTYVGYSIEEGVCEYGSLASLEGYYDAGDEVRIPVTIDAGYNINGVSITNVTEYVIEGNEIVFIMPSSSVVIDVDFDVIEGVVIPVYYTIDIEGTVGGTILVESEKVLVDETFTVTAIADEGYALVSIEEYYIDEDVVCLIDTFDNDCYEGSLSYASNVVLKGVFQVVEVNEDTVFTSDITMVHFYSAVVVFFGFVIMMQYHTNKKEN